MTVSQKQSSGQKDIFEMYPHLAYIADTGEDIWESAVSMGNDALTTLDSAKWRIGDLALSIVGFYGGRAPRGTDLLSDYARAINADVGRVREYCTVAKFWTPDHRAEVLNYANITYTHCRDAMRLGDIKSAKKFLRKCADADWTVIQARQHIASQVSKAPMLIKIGNYTVEVIEQTGALLLVQLLPQDNGAPIPQLKRGGQYQISIYEFMEQAR